MAILKPGIYLQENKPRRKQHQPRRSLAKPVIVIHTAESGTTLHGKPDPKAENVARFIRNRTTPGSYHLIGDQDTIIQLVPFHHEAYQDTTGSNRWALSISLAMNAEDWPRLPTRQGNNLINTAVQMAVISARWLQTQGINPPQARLITRSASERADASGFISHARRDPQRRTDPGQEFPWKAFLIAYQKAMAKPTDAQMRRHLTRQLQHIIRVPADGVAGPDTVKALNQNWLGYHNRFDKSVNQSLRNHPDLVRWVQHQLNKRDHRLKVDGGYGPSTERAVIKELKRAGIVAAESFLALCEPALE